MRTRAEIQRAIGTRRRIVSTVRKGLVGSSRSSVVEPIIPMGELLSPTPSLSPLSMSLVCSLGKVMQMSRGQLSKEDNEEREVINGVGGVDEKHSLPLLVKARSHISKCMRDPTARPKSFSISFAFNFCA